VDNLTGYFRRHKNVPEIPKSQRYATRSALETIFERSILSDRAKRNRRMREAVEKFGYT
jgi:ribulose 1,5-bisphosphate carboxylase large subunit-like protein